MTNDGLIERLETDEAVIAAAVVARMAELHPDLFARFPNGRHHCFEDTRFHIQHLVAALDLDDGDVFRGYRTWLEGLLAARGVGRDDVDANLAVLRAELTERYGDDAAAAARFLS